MSQSNITEIRVAVPATLNGGTPYSVTGTAVQVLAQNALRKGLIIQNTGATNSLTIGEGFAPVDGAATVLAPGQSRLYDANGLYLGPVYLISASGTTATVVEFN